MIRSYLIGVVALAVIVVSLAVAAVRVRQRLVPGWRGPIARLAEVTAGLALLFAVLHLLGSVGLFRKWVIVGGCVAAAVAVLGIVRAVGPWTDETDAGGDAVAHGPRPLWHYYVAFGLVTVVLAQWLSRTLATLDIGIIEYDSMVYHLPHAARFVQTGWITDLHFNSPEWPDNLHPEDPELLHAMGMALFGRDFLSPFLNLGWAALALLAGWCAGMRAGVAPLTMLAALVVVASPSLASHGPGAASSDVVSVGLFLTAVALLLFDHQRRGSVILAGAAAGLALGAKLTVLVPVVALTVALGLLVWRHRRALIVAWTVPLLLTGSFWFLRNLFATGSPMPSVKIGLGPIAFPEGRFAKIDELGYSIANYLTDGGVWRHYFLPGLDAVLGSLWWLLLGVVAMATVVCFARGTALTRALAACAVVAVLSHVVSPVSAMGANGDPQVFVLNLRYVYIGLAVPLMVAPTLPLLRRPRVQAGFIALATVLVIASQVADHPALNLTPWATTNRKAAVVLAVVAVGLGAAAAAYGRRVSRPLVAGLVVLAVVAGIGAGYVVERRFVKNRYQYDPVVAWARGTADTRIGHADVYHGYPLYGADLSNHVQYVGRTGPHGAWHDISRCTEWRSTLADGRYRFVVLASDGVNPRPRERWTSTDPAARLVLRTKAQAVYELTGSLDPASCPTGPDGEATDSIGLDDRTE